MFAASGSSRAHTRICLPPPHAHHMHTRTRKYMLTILHTSTTATATATTAPPVHTHTHTTTIHHEKHVCVAPSVRPTCNQPTDTTCLCDTYTGIPSLTNCSSWCATFEARHCYVSYHNFIVEGHCLPPVVFFHTETGKRLRVVKTPTCIAQMRVCGVWCVVCGVWCVVCGAGARHRQGPLPTNASQSQIINKNGATSGFEMCFAPSTFGAGGKTRLEFSIKRII